MKRTRGLTMWLEMRWLILIMMIIIIINFKLPHLDLHCKGKFNYFYFGTFRVHIPSLCLLLVQAKGS